MHDALVEREDELGAIDDALTAAAAGEGQLVLVVGPAGCGKTALLRATASASSHWQRCRATGGEFERAASLGVVRELFAGVPDLPVLLAQGAAAHAAPLFTTMTAAPADAAMLRYAVYWLVAGLAERRRLLMIIDDLQWADGPSLEFVEYLAARLEGLPVALLVAWREGELGSDSAALDRLSAQPTARILRPLPLACDSALELLRRRVGAAATAERAAAMHEASAGNAFLLHELIEEQWRGADGALPPTPERVVRAVRTRLTRLPPAPRALADAVALIGRGARLADAAALAGLADDEAPTALDALVAADVLRPERPLDFVHPLVRRALHDALPPGRLAASHLQAARLLASADADAEDVGRHLLETEPAGDAWAVERLLDALARALGRGAAEMAARYGDRALAEPPPHDMRLAVLRALGDAKARLASADALVHLAAAAALSDDPAERLLLAVRRALAAMGTVEFGDDELDRLAEAIDRDGRTDPAAAAIGRALLVGATLVGPPRPGTAIADAAEAARVSLPPGLARRALACFLSMHSFLTGDTATRTRELAIEAVGDDREFQETLAAGWQLGMTTFVLVALGDDDLALRRSAESVDSARGERGPWALFCCLVEAATAKAIAGDLAGAEADATEVVQLIGAVDARMREQYATLAISVATTHRDPLRGLELLDEVGGDGELCAAGVRPLVVSRRALLRLAAGDTAGALADAMTARELSVAQRFAGGALTWIFEALAITSRAAGHEEQARDAAQAGLAAAEHFGSPLWRARVAFVAALTAPGEQRTAALAQVLPTLAADADPVCHAEGLLSYGAALRRGRQHVDARHYLEQARALAHRCGARHLADVALVELRASGARPRRVATTGVEALTPSELRVAEMASAGHTNREIAQLLYVTRTTVEKHLHGVFRKLDVSSRTEIAAALTS